MLAAQGRSILQPARGSVAELLYMYYAIVLFTFYSKVKIRRLGMLTEALTCSSGPEKRARGSVAALLYYVIVLFTFYSDVNRGSYM